MKIQEFRDKMKSADHTALEKIAADLYRRIPKSTKEDGLDEAIEQMLKGEAAPKPVSRKNERIPFDQLKNEITVFLSHVDANYYWEPNRVVPKAQRSKWRFTVMRFLKQLDMIPANDENAEEAAHLYLEIYKRLAYGCGIYIFPTEDPFAAIQRKQSDFYPIMAARYFANGFTDAKILDMLRAATCVYIDRNSLYCELEQAFIHELRTHDMREKAMEIAKAEIIRLETEVLPKAESARWGTEEYYVKRNIREICTTITGLGIATYEEADAVAFFLSHARERDHEVELYVALKDIDFFGGSNDLWIKTYEKAVKKGVKPRDRLVEEYEERKRK